MSATAIPGIKLSTELPADQRDEIHAAGKLIRGAIRACVYADISPGAIANVLAFEAATLVALLSNDSRRELAISSLEQNFRTMVGNIRAGKDEVAA